MKKALALLSTTTLETIIDELSMERNWKEDKEVEDFHGLVAEVWKLNKNYENN